VGLSVEQRAQETHHLGSGLSDRLSADGADGRSWTSKGVTSSGSATRSTSRLETGDRTGLDLGAKVADVADLEELVQVVVGHLAQVGDGRPRFGCRE
jgi:hypothetical protein